MAKLKFFYGTMGSGKSTELIKTCDIYERKGIQTAIIKPTTDDRNGKQNGWGTIQSRLINISKKAYYFDNIIEEVTNGLKFDMLFVDEAQFLHRQDIQELVNYVDKYNIDVYCYGLKTDINGNLFAGTRELLVYADECIELKNLCQYERCNKPANFHLRYIDGCLDTSQQPICIEKGNITYMSVCRKHWQQQLKTNGRE